MYLIQLHRARLVCFLLTYHVIASSTNCPTSPLFLRLSNCTAAHTTVDSWGVKFSISTPPQYVCLVPSTVLNSTLVIDSKFCANNANLTTAQCESLCGNTFDTSTPGTAFKSAPNTVLAPNPVWADISPEELNAGNVLLQWPPDQHLSDYPIGIITSGENHNVGHLGLANNSEFLQSALAANLTTRNGFGLDAGSQSVANPRPGGLVLGGYDLSRIDGVVSRFQTDASARGRECPLLVTVSQLVLRFPTDRGPSDIKLVTPGTAISACVEPYDNLFRLPQTLLQYFQDVTGWSANTTADPNINIIEPGLFYPQAQGFNGSLIFTIVDRDGGSIEVEIPNNELSNPLRGINKNGARVLQPNITEVGIFFQNALLDSAVLGKIFLSQVYMAVDYAAREFILAPISSEDTAPNLVFFNSSLGTCAKSDTFQLPSWVRKNTEGLWALSGFFSLFLIIIVGFAFLHIRFLVRRVRALEEVQKVQETQLRLLPGGQEVVLNGEGVLPHGEMAQELPHIDI